MKTTMRKAVSFSLTVAFLLTMTGTALITIQPVEAKPRASRHTPAAVVEETQTQAPDTDDSTEQAGSDPTSSTDQSASEQPKETDPYTTSTKGQVGVSLFNVLFNVLEIYLCVVAGVLLLGFGGVFLGAVVWHGGKTFRGGRPPVIG
jgi:hypothetical protein